MGQHLVQQVEIGLHGVHLREVAVTVPTVPHTRWLHRFHEDVFPMDIRVCAKGPDTHGVCHAQYQFDTHAKRPQQSPAQHAGGSLGSDHEAMADVGHRTG